MDVKLLREIDYLTQLIRERKTMPSPEKSKNTFVTNVHDVHASVNMSSEFQSNDATHCKGTNTCIYMKPLSVTTTVHVNPNFKSRKPVIHINPKIRAKPLIHINPKMVKDVTSENVISSNCTRVSNPFCESKERTVETSSACTKQPMIHINPRIINSVNHSNENIRDNTAKIASNHDKNFPQVEVKQSVHVNPKLMSKLSSIKQSNATEKKKNSPSVHLPVNSRLKYVKKQENLNTLLNPIVPAATLPSQRKLIKTRSNTKVYTTTSPTCSYKVKRLVISPQKKSQTTALKAVKHITANTRTLQPKINKSNILRCQSGNKYKIDRTTIQLTHHMQTEKSTVSGLSDTKHKSMELVTIGGIVYKSSRNQLIRRSLPLKKKSAVNVGNDKFIVATNGRKLRRLKTTKELPSRKSLSRVSELKTKSSLKVNRKTNISNKVKQRSIQILQNKMRKNNQPCLFFQRFGYCANQKNGTCPKRHDRKQISVCKKFLQGKCLLDNCPLSHDVGPEKMPTCKYFLDACCTRDKCPYLHVKVSPNTPICIEFLQGYCAKGNECKRRHEYLCPEFYKLGKCNKGKYCPYPHKTNATAQQTVLKSDGSSEKICRKKCKTEVHQSETAHSVENDISSFGQDCKLRYYENTDTVDKDFATVRENIMKKIQIMKEVEIAHRSNETAIIDTTSEIALGTETIVKDTDDESQVNSDKKFAKRPPIGSLPAFIPID